MSDVIKDAWEPLTTELMARCMNARLTSAEVIAMAKEISTEAASGQRTAKAPRYVEEC